MGKATKADKSIDNLNPDNWRMFFAADRERHQWHIEGDYFGTPVCGYGETAGLPVDFSQTATTPVCAMCLKKLYDSV